MWQSASSGSRARGASGLFGLLAAIAATALGARTRTAEEQLHEMSVDRARLRRELDALAAIFAEEATRRNTPGADVGRWRG